MKRKLIVALGLLVSLFFLWVAFRGLNPQEVLGYLGAVSPLVLLGGMVVFLLSMVAIAWRWGFLLRALQPLPLRYLSELVAIGYMGNNVYPFRTGEVLRVVLLQRDYRVPMARSATTVLVERVFDGLVMLSFIILPLAFLENTSAEVQAVVGIAAPIFVIALGVFLALAARPHILRRLITLLAAPLPDRPRALVLSLADEVLRGLEGLRSARDLAGTVAASYLSWLLNALVYWLVAVGFGIEVGFGVILIVVGVVNLAGLLPASPGQVGVFEFFASRVLIGAGVGEAQATAYALLVHIVIWLPPTLLGFYLLARRGLGWSAVTRARALETAEGQQTPAA